MIKGEKRNVSEWKERLAEVRHLLMTSSTIVKISSPWRNFTEGRILQELSAKFSLAERSGRIPNLEGRIAGLTTNNESVW
jgi:hypothetical protein